MDAIELLMEQHREVEALFEEAEEARTAASRRKIFEQIADALAVHATIEEKIFYPAAKFADTASILYESVEEHLAAKRLIADLVELDPSDVHYRAKIVVLKEEIRHHVHEEEKELFPKAKKHLDEDERAELGDEMEQLAETLRSDKEPPRMHVREETAAAAPLP